LTLKQVFQFGLYALADGEAMAGTALKLCAGLLGRFRLTHRSSRRVTCMVA
jgi:hypothetical protein